MVSSFSRTALAVAAVSLAVQQVSAHACLYDKSMWGFNWTTPAGGEDNRPVAPLQDMNFDRWWWHGHKNLPPNEGDFMELPAGGKYSGEIVCDKGASSYWTSNAGGRTQGDTADDVCPGKPTTVFHANDESDVAGCALSIAYKSNADDVKPEDLVIFSVNHLCPWKRFTDFQVPANMPACPEGGCICGWHWIHEGDSGSAQMYLNMYRCQVTGATATKAIGTPVVARECGASAHRGIATGKGDCVVGPKAPFYWKQNEGNNVVTSQPQLPPVYNGLYGFNDGAQDDIFTGDGVAAPAAGSSSSSSLAAVATTSANARPVDPTTSVAGGGAATTSAASEASPTTDSPSPAESTSAASTSIASTSTDAPAPTTTTRRCKRKQRRSSLERLHKRHHNVGRFVKDSTIH